MYFTCVSECVCVRIDHIFYIRLPKLSSEASAVTFTTNGKSLVSSLLLPSVFPTVHLPYLVSEAHFWQLLRLLSSQWSRRWPWRSPYPLAEPQRYRTYQTGSSALGPSYLTEGRKRRKMRHMSIYSRWLKTFFQLMSTNSNHHQLILYHYGFPNLKKITLFTTVTKTSWR